MWKQPGHRRLGHWASLLIVRWSQTQIASAPEVPHSSSGRKMGVVLHGRPWVEGRGQSSFQ